MWVVVLGILVTFLRMILIGIGVVVIGVLIVDGDLLLGNLAGSLVRSRREAWSGHPEGGHPGGGILAMARWASWEVVVKSEIKVPKPCNPV